MSNTNIEEIQYRSYDSNRIQAKRHEIYEFLLNLTVERKTLLWSDEIDEEEYPEACNKMVSSIEHAVLAYDGDRIVGIETCSKRGTGFLAKISPFRTGLTVVKSEYQGRGIGGKLYGIHDEFVKGQWFFWHHITRIENKVMLQLDESYGVNRVGNDGKFVHGFASNRDELKIFNPIAYLLLRLFYIEKNRIKKIFRI